MYITSYGTWASHALRLKTTKKKLSKKRKDPAGEEEGDDAAFVKMDDAVLREYTIIINTKSIALSQTRLM